MSKLLEEAAARGGNELSKMSIEQYIHATSRQGDKSNQDLINKLHEAYYEGGSASSIVTILTKIHQKHKNVGINKELGIYKKIAKLQSDSMLGNAI